MTNYYDKSPFRIPVKLTSGRWKLLHGGEIPVKEGACAELILEKHSITDPIFLAAMEKPSTHLMLTGPLELLVALTVKGSLDSEYLNLLYPENELKFGSDYYSSPRSSETRFVPISIGMPTPEFVRLHKLKSSGIWLTMEGMHPKGLLVSSVKIPDVISNEPLISLNHAFTKLSEVYEPWRKSHTGNIYTRILYRELNNKWYPLEVLRNAAEATEEQAIIKTRWSEIKQLNAG